MSKLINQIKFDGKRLILRNSTFVFFSLMMPSFFYILFTKVMVIGNAKQIEVFNATYMGSMMVYSMLISSLMGISTFLARDRDQGFLTFLRITNQNLSRYYISVGFLSSLMNFITMGVVGLVAIVVNQVSLDLMQWLAIVGLILIGQLPILLVGMLISLFKRQETLSIVCNLIAFPTAIVSGLWWPIQLLPTWLQKIGRHLPTYYLNHMIGQVVNNVKISGYDLIGLVIWIFGMMAIGGVILMGSRKRSMVVSD
jgi:ABC-2 type transport system permease protein